MIKSLAGQIRALRRKGLDVQCIMKRVESSRKYTQQICNIMDLKLPLPLERLLIENPDKFKRLVSKIYLLTRPSQYVQPRHYVF